MVTACKKFPTSAQSLKQNGCHELKSIHCTHIVLNAFFQFGLQFNQFSEYVVEAVYNKGLSVWYRNYVHWPYSDCKYNYN